VRATRSLSSGKSAKREGKVILMLRVAWIAMVLVVGCGSATLRSSDGGAGQGGAAAGTGVGGHAGGGGHLVDAAVDGPTHVDATGPATWCTQQAAPAGVAATDYACVDFDDGKVPSGGGWSSMIANGGTSAVTTQHASSLPDGWQISVGTSGGSKAALGWHAAGSHPIASVTVAADISPIAGQGVIPAWTGTVSLVCLAFGSGQACLRYTMGQDTSFATGYTGYYLMVEYVGGAAILNEYQVYGTLQPNLWTRVQMQITAASKQIQVTIPGVTNAAVTGHFDPDTAVDVTLGPETSGATSGWSGYLDNIVIDVARSS
jgi:hypothetical protein